MLVPSEKPLSRIWHLNFAETKKSHQYFNHDHDETHIMTMIKLISTMIKHTKIKKLIGPIFFFPGDSHTKGMLFLLHLGLEGITEVDTDPKGRFVSFKVTTSNESSLFVPLQGIAPESSWLGGAFLKDYKNICKIKMREMKTK